ncbi:MAG: AMP-binding protein, partial [Actinomycetota bacterium]|nr:AMP-binding protein [Actinomycetota bacterium]
MGQENEATRRFREARDYLLQHREDYATAYKGYTPPKLDQFNWALDWFDAIAVGNDRPAIWIQEEDGREAKLSFEEMSKRSNQVANWLRSLGVRRGDRFIVMLGNQV